MFTTASDFTIPPYSIPTMKTPELFQAFIDQEEAKYLLEVLGRELYEAFVAGLIADWVSTAPTVIGKQYAYGNDIWQALTVQTGTAPVAGSDWTLIEEDNRWLLLKNGNTYEVNDKEYKWYGMVKTLVPLVYSKWVEYGASELTSNGFVIPKMENNVSVNPDFAICRSWNDWNKQVGGFCAPYNTLYGYLYYSGTTFDDVIPEFGSIGEYLSCKFKEQGNKNVFGI